MPILGVFPPLLEFFGKLLAISFVLYFFTKNFSLSPNFFLYPIDFTRAIVV